MSSRVGRKRNAENQGLPARWRHYHGAYYYRVPFGFERHWDGKTEFQLGTTLPEAYRIWADRIGAQARVRTIAELLDRYAVEVVPSKAATNQTQHAHWIKQLRGVFGAMPLDALEPQHIYQYVEKRSRKKTSDAGKTTGGRIAAHREVEVLSHALTKAVQWGYIRAHPFKNEVRLEGEAPRERYIEDWEVVEVLSLPSVRKRGSVLAIQCYIRLKLLTGLRRSDLLRLQVSSCREDGIHVRTNKTGKAVIYTWTPELRAAVEGAKAARPVHIAPFLFCGRKGQGYLDEGTGLCSGWKSMWQRFMDRVLRETKVTERFTEHDLRAKCASDAESLEHARAMLAHADARTTELIYRRRPERVRPAR
jgi:integrase